jgi:hypothetical protein
MAFLITLCCSLDVNRDELIDEEFLFGGMKLTAKEQAEYRLVSFIFNIFIMVLDMSIGYGNVSQV